MEAFSPDTPQAKTIAIVAHITIIGWVVALILNQNEQSSFGAFYIRQTLGLMLMSLLAWIPLLGWLVGLVCIILWVVSLIQAASEKAEPLPIVGEYFQQWFASIR